MILGAHQPNYIPWIGYFHKMARADKFILADDVQYTSQSYTNRTRIKTARGRHWLSVPVLTRGRGCQPIKDVRIDRSKNWRKKHWKTLCVNYTYAPFFDHYADFFEKLYRKEWTFLADLNIAILEFLRREFAICTPLYLSSELDLKLENSTGRIINMVKVLNCDQYISGRGASVDYLEEDLFREAGIELIYDDFDHPYYRQQFGEFLPNLGAIDLLFNEGPRCRRYFSQGDPVAQEQTEEFLQA